MQQFITQNGYYCGCHHYLGSEFNEEQKQRTRSTDAFDKKGEQMYFGMKAHIGVDAESGLVHTVVGTPANVHDVTQTTALLHGEEKHVLGDASYRGIQNREEAKGLNLECIIAMMHSKRKKLQPEIESHRLTNELEKLKSGIRAKIEHAFRVLKCQFGYRKVRYKGIEKNLAQQKTLFALGNLWLVRKKLLAMRS